MSYDPTLPAAWATILIIVGSAAGGLFAAFCAWIVSRISLDPNEQDSEATALMTDEMNVNSREIFTQVALINKWISDGATAFLMSEYKYMLVFVALFSVVIFVLLGTVEGHWDFAGFSTLAFITGAATSIASGWIGMRIAVYTNARVTLTAAASYPDGFRTAFTGGIVMGFGLTSLGLIVLFLAIVLFKIYYNEAKDVQNLYGSIAAYGLGGSSIALFGRVGGGIFTKAADVGADLVGKVQQDIPEDDPRNPGVIADCIGDNVGDIAGMGSDLFGSFGEATCAALVIAAASPALSDHWTCMMYPLLITAVGILVCILTSLLATHIKPAQDKEGIEPTLKLQLLVSCVLCTIALCALTFACLPYQFEMKFLNGSVQIVKCWYCWLALCTGLWSGLGIGYVTEYFTSNQYSPVREVANACVTGAATNIIHGLALGYKSAIFPAIALATTIFISYNLCSVFGIALGALGILSTMSICLTVDAYGPISDNAGGIAEMAHMGEHVRERTDALDAAGNTTAAIGKGYAIGSAALVGLALYGAFLTRAYDTTGTGVVIVNVVDPRTFFGLLIGAMLPYWFSAMTMKSVGKAAMEMVEEIRHQFRTIPGLMEGTATPDYKNCVRIATDASLKEMLPPGALVVLSPIIFGIVFGPEALAGLLPGSLVSGVQMAISASNTGGAWDNAKKYVEAGGMGKDRGKKSEVHKAAVIGDTVGDPLKDTSGPALNILVKLMAIISVVFAPVVARDAKLGGIFFNKLLKHWVLDRDDTFVQSA